MKEKSPNDRLSKRVVRGGAWVFALRIVNQGLSIIKLIILARILSPEDFGLMGIALLTMSSLEMFSQTGFQAALIQKKENVDAYLNSAWTIMIIRGLVLFGILYIIAPYVAVFFNSPQAQPIIRVIGFSILFLAFSNIGIIYFQKDLEFNKQFMYQLSGTVVDFVVAISVVVIFKNVWALVFGLLAGNFARFIASFIIHPYKPRLSFDFNKTKELFSFGKWIFSSNILVFLILQGSSIFVGRMLGTTMLGYYQMADKVAKITSTEFTKMLSLVTFPAYSILQNNLSKLREAFFKVYKFIAFISIPLSVLICVLASEFTAVFFGLEWMPMVPVLQILLLVGILRCLLGALSPVFLSLGKPDVITKLQAVQTIFLFMILFIFTKYWGIVGAALASLLTTLVMFFIRNHIFIQMIKCKARDFYKVMLYPLVSVMICMFLIIYLKSAFINMVALNSLVQLSIVFTFVFISLICLADRYLNYGIRALLRESLKLF